MLVLNKLAVHHVGAPAFVTLAQRFINAATAAFVCGGWACGCVTLDTARWRDPRLAAAEEAEVSNELLDSRSNFLGFCQQQHWQFNELSRAHYTTMLLARLGGLEEHEHGGLANSC